MYSDHICAILRVLIHIEAHLDEPMALEKLAKIARISPFHFHRLFRAYTGETCLEYMQRLRLQRAEEKLRYTDSSITSIALDVGYETSSSFGKMFQQIMGRSPREYRNAMQPIVKKMLKRTLVTPAWKPTYVQRTQESVLFVRRVGDYRETPELAFNALIEFLHKNSIDDEEITGFYSIALDDPKIVDRTKCRFDACVATRNKLLPKGEVGMRKLPGGRFACFEYKGPTSGIEGAFDEIYRSWYPTSGVTLSDKESLCEYLDLFDEEHSVTKIYIPIL